MQTKINLILKLLMINLFVNMKGDKIMTTLKSVAIALVVIKPGSKDMQTGIIVDDKVRSF